jgi:rubrerythrin
MTDEEIQRIADKLARQVLRDIGVPTYVEPKSVIQALESSMMEERAAAHFYKSRDHYCSQHGDTVTARLYEDIASEEDEHERKFRERLADLGEKVEVKKLPTRDQVRVEVWEERDRLHIGIQDKETGNYYADWWDEEARQMFEDGFFKSGGGLENSVLEYAEDTGILAK